VWVEIEDNGCGISREQQQKIFDPFFTTKPVGKGTGLGLSLSYGIIQKHRGQIFVTSEVGRGTIVSISLPLTQPSIPPSTGSAKERSDV
jgi:two-component system NtrC family sensor kinase